MIMVRVRFAPSPTGHLHIGSARTALFNWLFAKNQGGVFILRIEDTDIKRNVEEAFGAILSAMEWLGLNWDEGPYYQSERMELYRGAIERLLEEGKAYPCYCLPEELEERRREALERGEKPMYDRRCRELSDKERARLEREGRKPAFRFKVPLEGKTVFKDIIRGRIEFLNEEIEDFVIMRRDGIPTYNLACVVDDHHMQITHIIRGEDHISNTPKQILLYKALGYPIPQFAHLPMILGPDKSRLSKRHGATSVNSYKEQGFLPEAMLNFLALLGWSPGGNREIISREEMIKEFSLERVKKHPAIFNIDKLIWINSHYMKTYSPARLARLAVPFLVREGLIDENYPISILEQIIPLVQERAKTLGEIGRWTDYFFLEKINYDEQAVEEWLRDSEHRRLLSLAEEALSQCEPFTKEKVEEVLRGLAEKEGVKAKEIFHPLRVAVTGRTVSPPLIESLVILGKERTLKRIEEAISLFSEE
ncbi:MAG: glutamate--tRNA ligase [bacterium]